MDEKNQLIGPPQPDTNFDIDPKVRADLEKRRRARNADLAAQIAFMEYGISRYIDEDDLCRNYEISREALHVFKKVHRADIERSKEEHKYGKFRLYKAISQALTLREVMVQADIEGNSEIAANIAQILKRADSVLPFKQMKEMAEIMKIIDDAPQESKTPQGATINVNLNAIKEAQEAFDKRMSQTVIDIEEKK